MASPLRSLRRSNPVVPRPRPVFRAALAGLLCAIILAARPAFAQLRRHGAPPTVLPASLAAPEDALGVDWNPAVLGLLPTWSLVYVGSAGPEQPSSRADAHAMYAATPLLFGLAAGVGVSSYYLPGAAGPRAGATSLALGWGPSRALGVGAVVRFLTGREAGLTGVVTLDLAATWRPSPTLALSLLARDSSGPDRAGPVGGTLPRSFVLAAGLRPFGTEALTLDASAALDDRGRIAARGALGVAVPSLGQVLCAVEADRLGRVDQALTLAAALRVQWDTLSVVAGAAAPADLAGIPGAVWSARVEGAPRRPGLPRSRYALEVALRGLDERSMIATTLRLERALYDDRVAGVLLRLDGSGLGLAWAQEIRLLVAALEAAGKPVVCHLEAGTGAEFYACAGASRVLVDPGGGVRLVGPSSTVVLLGDLLRAAGVRADFVRVGPFKSAAEQLLNRRASGPARVDRDALYDDVYRRFVDDLAGDLRIDRAAVTAVIDAGPYLAEEAVRAGLVSGAADAADLDDALREVTGASLPRVRSSWSDARSAWSTPRRVGVVVVDGDIVDGKNIDVPGIGLRLSGSQTVVEAIDALAADASVRAIVVRIDSPGGSSLASDQIWRAIRRARRRKPVLASLGAIAASGGYYVASATQEIWADPATITGSIGIYYGKVDLAPLAERLGVGIESFGRGRRSGAESVYRPFTPDERAVLAEKVRHLYRLFLRRVAEGRGMDVATVDALARGRVYSGDAARRHGLVDRLGGLASAVARARELTRLPVDAEVIVVPRRPSSLADFLLGGLFGSAAALDPTNVASAHVAAGEVDPTGDRPALPHTSTTEQLQAVLRTVLTHALMDDGSAQARLPFDVRLE
jgi:protease-4